MARRSDMAHQKGSPAHAGIDLLLKIGVDGLAAVPPHTRG